MEIGKKLTRERFLSDVDDHFICPQCHGVVSQPKECEECQILVCAACLSNLHDCPAGGHVLATRDISRFPRKIYESLQLKCRNCNSGCQFTGPITAVQGHEDGCEFMQIKCLSPVCSNTFLRRDKKETPGQPLVCSDNCLKVCQFQKILEQADDLEILRELFSCIMATKAAVEQDLKAQLVPRMAELSLIEAEMQTFETSKPSVTEELELRKQKYHAGKWNAQMKEWTCCANEQILSVGCRSL